MLDMRRKTTDPEYRLMVLTWQYHALDATPLEGLLNRGYEIVRVDAMPGVPGCGGRNVGECAGHEGGNVGGWAIPPALVYVLRRKGE